MYDVVARLQLAISAEFYRRGWMYHIPIPTDPEAPDSVALLAVRREALEEAAKECVDIADPGIGGEWESAAMACAEAIRALLTDEHSPEQAGSNPAGETDREPVGPGDVQRSENEADERGEQE